MEFYKIVIAKENAKLIAIIPIISSLLGGLLGLCAFFLCPAIISATNAFTAVLVGVCSGLSATGCNQIFKQLNKVGIEVKENDKENNDEPGE